MWSEPLVEVFEPNQLIRRDGRTVILGPAPAGHQAPPGGTVEAATLWAGAVATTLVAGLVSIVGVVATQTLPNVHVIAPSGGGDYVEATAWRLTAATVIATLAAALLMHLLLLLNPRPLLFFQCVTLLMTATVTLWPFTTDAALSSKTATALVYLSVGVSIATLTATVAHHVHPR